jgi:hypothetical protein
MPSECKCRGVGRTTILRFFEIGFGSPKPAEPEPNRLK